jgi:hypothetical protein
MSDKNVSFCDKIMTFCDKIMTKKEVQAEKIARRRRKSENHTCHDPHQI